MGVPQERYDQVITSLKADLKAADGHLDTGIFGTQFFFEVLTENALHQEAYEAISKTDYPSFGYWLADGATTTREHWNEDGSYNHPMFGAGIVWMYRKLAGMEVDPKNPGL